MMFRIATALCLVFALAACEGDDIPPPDPEPQIEGTVQPDDAASTPQGGETDSASDNAEAAPTPEPENAAPTEEAMTEAEMDAQLEAATQEAEARAQEIFDEVTSESADRDATEAEALIDMPEPEAQGQSQATMSAPQGSQAILPAMDTLQPDTVDAAESAGGAAPEYVGVWATRPQDCELVDQATFDEYAVITSNSIRFDGNVCAIEAVPFEGGTVSLPASCSGPGTDQERTFSISSPETDRIEVGEPDMGLDAQYVRCYPQG